jgi:hypothetical protein
MRILLALALLAMPLACSDASGQRCGGNIQHAPTCPSGYTCVSVQDGGPPVGDVGGVCKKN